MRALVLGCGSIGSRHAHNLAHLGVEVVVSDIDDAAAAGLASALGTRAVSRHEAPPCDLVVVATPSVVHVDDLRWALERGSDVFVEKPLAVSRHGAAEARALLEAHPGRVAMVGCNLRFSQGYAAVVDNLHSIGTIAAVIADYGWWLPAWRPATDYPLQYSARRALGGGIVLDAIHELDYVLALAGDASGVSGICSSSGILDIDVEDVADIALRHHGGAQSHIHLDYLRRVYSRSCTVIGSRGQITWDVPRGVVELVEDAGAAPIVLATDVDADANAQYVAEMRHLLDAIANRTATCNDVDHAATTVEVALTARDGPQPTTVAVIQARMGSTRFPGKVLADLQGRPMLAHIIERVSSARSIDRVVVATTTEPGDDAVAALAEAAGVMVTRGPAEDVLTRFVMAAEQAGADIVVRITADCPLVDPTIIDAVVRVRAESGADYASNNDPPSFPDGYDVEVFTRDCLARLDRTAQLEYLREHVTAHVRENHDEYSVTRLGHGRDLSNIRLTVDVPADLERVATVLSLLPDDPRPGLAAVIGVVESIPALQRQDGLPSRNERYRAQRDAVLRQGAGR